MIHDHQMLELFCTDLWCNYAALPKTITQFKTIEKASNFFHAELPQEKVRAFNLLGLRIRLAYRRAKKNSNYSLYREFMHYGRSFCQHVNKLPPQDHNAFLGFTCGALETLEFERNCGNLAILDQIHAGKTEDILIQEEREAWPRWDCREDPKPEEYHQRLEAEWHAAHLVVVNSVFSKNGLVAQGIQAEKIALIPEAFMAEGCVSIRNKWADDNESSLKVIFLSNVTLLKGIQYLIQTARLMAKEPVKFVIVGSINIHDKIIRDAPPNMQFIGKVNPNRVNEWLDKSHVLVFPTICDGFGRVQLEAMARGLPVIATPNCAEVVTDGIDGFIVPIRDPEALREKIQKILDQPDLLPFLSQNALKKVASFSFEAVGELWQKKIESAFLTIN
jgi:glycosyltransferase involved in cell wall biosynthesis